MQYSSLRAEIKNLRKENAQLKQMIAEDCCSKIEANQRIFAAQREAAGVFIPEIERLKAEIFRLKGNDGVQ